MLGKPFEEGVLGTVIQGNFKMYPIKSSKQSDQEAEHLCERHLEVYRQQYEEQVNKWAILQEKGMDAQTCQQVVGISRSTYYRHRKILANLERGILPPPKQPKKVNQPHWGETEKQLVLRVRQQNPTYGKAKIAVILARDYGRKLSESMVGRILKYLMTHEFLQKSPSSVRQKRKRDFIKGHAKAWSYKKYEDIEMGERVQVDHMTVRKNGHAKALSSVGPPFEIHLCSSIFSCKEHECKRLPLPFFKKCPL